MGGEYTTKIYAICYCTSHYYYYCYYYCTITVTINVIHSSLAGCQNTTVSLTMHFFFNVLPKKNLTTRHVLGARGDAVG